MTNIFLQNIRLVNILDICITTKYGEKHAEESVRGLDKLTQLVYIVSKDTISYLQLMCTPVMADFREMPMKQISRNRESNG